ncbi:AAA family ATPase [Methylobacterium sp. WCS2018Hpa-22]|uniref:bifunctional aminoglycoside phosphotransferase/ATP-binding protein n=1 Tax=Methylobacterium sp. WCS2018Hpa-22 TaxID=3073633 RepID=UPI00288BDEC7|nr:AAA family ATPase [Methylobacterium sp. WCS2018Hpa-22]
MSNWSQAEVVDFLTRSLEGSGQSVGIMRTHISEVFLGDGRVFKLKRAVRFPYLDFSTAERRLAMCLAEFDLNYRTAPSLYIGVHRITREPDGSLAFDGQGPLIDAVVEMHRFPQEDLFDEMARTGRLGPELVADLAHRIAAFHARAEVSQRHGGSAAMGALIEMNDKALRATLLATDGEAQSLADCFRRTLKRHGVLIDSRRAAGKVRRCHGDLTLRNICLFDGVPTPFDCIEFDEAIATIDVLYDLAFVLMDLWHREQRDLANLLFNRYLDEADETNGLGLLPFLMALRAIIRAHVTAVQAEGRADDERAETRTEARAYLDLAKSLLDQAEAGLVAVGGLSGSGKSTVAALVAPWLGAPPGARILSSDRIRKRLHGVTPTTRLPAAAYEASVSERVYATLRQEVGKVLETGHCAIADAVFDRPRERTAMEAVASEMGRPFQGVWLQAPMVTLTARIERRRLDPSDATVDVLAAQVKRDCGRITWRRVDARLAPEALRAKLLSEITFGDRFEAQVPQSDEAGMPESAVSVSVT